MSEKEKERLERAERIEELQQLLATNNVADIEEHMEIITLIEALKDKEELNEVS